MFFVADHPYIMPSGALSVNTGREISSERIYNPAYTTSCCPPNVHPAFPFPAGRPGEWKAFAGSGTHIGLANARERLENVFGGDLAGGTKRQDI